MDIATEDLKTEINAILKTADLSVISAKKVREQVEKKLKCSLLSRKKEVDDIVMDFLNQQQEEEAEDASSASPEEEPSSDEDKKKAKKRKPAQRKAAPTKSKKRKSLTASDSGSESDAGSDSDFEMPKRAPKAGKKKAAGGGGGGGGAKKSTGFTRAYNLSPELSALMGSDSLPRHEVVKKVWAIIKERNLYDPKNKQYTICDDDLFKVMKVKRFRTFAMLKHLKPHFID